ncbi:hypothetical protein GNW65_24755 [Escherichia coli]|nr:hypothetical protein [Escherichia coli]
MRDLILQLSKSSIYSTKPFATKWGRAALPHERLTYFPLEDLIKNNGKKIRSDKKHFLECNEDK